MAQRALLVLQGATVLRGRKVLLGRWGLKGHKVHSVPWAPLVLRVQQALKAYRDRLVKRLL